MTTKRPTHQQLHEAWEADPLAAAVAADLAPKVLGETSPAADLAWFTGRTLREATRHLGGPTVPTYEVAVAEGDLNADPQTTEAVLQWLAEGRVTP